MPHNGPSDRWWYVPMMGRFNWIPTKKWGFSTTKWRKSSHFSCFCGSWKANVLMSLFFELTFFGLNRLKHTFSATANGCKWWINELQHPVGTATTRPIHWIFPSKVYQSKTIATSTHRASLTPTWSPDTSFFRWMIEGWSWSKFPYFSLCEVAWGCSASDQHSGCYDILAALRIA